MKITPFHPQTNGGLERFHSALKLRLTKFEDRKTYCNRLLNDVLFMYRSVLHFSTGVVPGEVFGDVFRGPVDVPYDACGGDSKGVSIYAEDWMKEVKKEATK